jgi:hypothetical protein
MIRAESLEKAGVFALIVWATVIREWSVLGLLALWLWGALALEYVARRQR